MIPINAHRQFITVAVLVLLCCGCKKEDESKALVGITGGGSPATVALIRVSHTTSPVTIVVAEIRRDVSNPSQLDKEITVQVKDNSVAVTAADPTFIVLPDTLYSVNTETPKAGGYYTVSFKPGEYKKAIRITIPNPSKLNALFKYALGFKVESAGVYGEVSSQSALVARITTINRWDGVYLNIGNPAAPDHGFRDVTSSAITWLSDQQYSLVTIGPTTCAVVNDDLSALLGGIYMYPGYLISNNIISPASYGNSYGLVISFDSVTNAISEIHNCYGDLGFINSWIWPANTDWNYLCIGGPPLYSTCNTRRAVLDPTGVNAMQPNKDIVIKHFMLQPSVVPAAPNIRCYFDETWKYLRAR